jgi:hypothetical protein
MNATQQPLRLPESDADAVCIGTGQRPAALLPGSFNPVHAGHWRLAKLASRLLGKEVAFELSLHNVDKPDLAIDDVRQRVLPFAGKADIWLTRAPTFVQKARLFPGTVFVVGADTAARVVSARYYPTSADQRLAIQTLLELQSSFLVAARVDTAGHLQALDDLALTPEWLPLFRGIDPRAFRVDISSTALRAQEG